MLTQLYVCGRFLLAYISRTVTHPSGAAIAGATVALENGVRVSMTGFQNSVQTGVPVVAGGERVGQPAGRKSVLDEICTRVDAHAALP